MKLSVLIENVASEPGFLAEHGLSLYIETGKHRILFDTGQSGAFVENAGRLGVELSKVDFVVLSHGHYDHGGGLIRFFEQNSHAPVYVSRSAFAPCYHAERYIGLDPSLEDSSRIVYTGDYFKVDDGIALYSCNACPRKYPTDSAGLTVQQGGSLVPDTFLHEQYLMLRDGARRVLLSGCSHKGILNLMEWLRPDVLIGGFHFMNLDVTAGENPVLDQAAEALCRYQTDYYTCHCTGQKQYEYLKAKMGGRLHYLTAGQILTI